MGSDDLFKKRREARTQRKHEYKPPKANSYLIVTEGERTEPLYFKGMQKLIQEKVGGVCSFRPYQNRLVQLPNFQNFCKGQSYC